MDPEESPSPSATVNKNPGGFAKKGWWDVMYYLGAYAGM